MIALIKKTIKKIFPKWNKKKLLKKKVKLFWEGCDFSFSEKKIVYMLTPPPSLSNIGDHAQVVAIYRWLKKNYPDLSIIEFDKNDCILQIDFIKEVVNPQDLIFIHSGGNLGDRGVWSETGRRNIIQAFPQNKIVSLPQTIFFSDSEKGRAEKENSIRIYNKHTDLTIIGRDNESSILASQLFPKSKVLTIPDFVLSLDIKDIVQKSEKREFKKILFCLRNDDESIFSMTEKMQLPILLKLEYDSFEYFDTTIDTPINIDRREDFLLNILNYFSQFELIITDRFHGLIFATLLTKHIIVLPTVDHKLTSAIDWFEGMPQIKFIQKEEIKSILHVANELLKERPVLKNWNELYFDRLKERL